MSKHYWLVKLPKETFILGANEDLTDKEAAQYCLGFGKVSKVSTIEAATQVERGMNFHELTPNEVNLLKDLVSTVSEFSRPSSHLVTELTPTRELA